VRDDALLERARAVHEKIITLDTHVDFVPAVLIGEPNYTQRLGTQCDLSKMAHGGLDGLFLVVYVGQTREAQSPDAFETAGYQRAYARAIEKFSAIHHFTAEIATDQIALALDAGAVRRIRAEGKKIALIGVENGYPLGDDPARLEEFYERGARYLSLTHNGHNQLADSHTGERDGWKWQGLSPLGERVIQEMNRLGMMIDVSHASKAAMLQIAARSRAPIIASHSAVRALCDVSRNLDDEQLLALKESGGVFHVVAYGEFIKAPKPASAERAEALSTLRRTFDLPAANGPAQRARFQAALTQLSEDRRAQYEAQLAEINEQHPGEPPASVSDFVDHIAYAIDLIGIDHVGIASDFDGGGGVVDWNDASETCQVTVELVRRGYTERQIEKLWSGNLLRVMDDVERSAKKL
jgi:membrane dipeptidase